MVVIGAGLFDMVDGRVARATDQVTRFGGFFDSVIDRYSDLALLMGLLVYYASINRFFYVVLTAVVMTGSVMVSYTRARAENAIPKCKVGFLERPERVVLIIIGALFDRMAAVLWVIAVLSNLTVVHRMIYTWQEAKRLEDAQLRAVPRRARSLRRSAASPRQAAKAGSQSSRITCAIPSSAVCVRESDTWRTLRRLAISAATPLQPQRGLAGRQIGHFEILPGDAALPARADGLHAGLFGREARGVAFVAVGLALHVRDLRGREDAAGETRPEALDGGADARHLGQIHAGAHDHFRSAPEVVMVSRPCLTPLALISVSAILRTSPDLPRTTMTSRQWSWSRWTCSVERIEW